MSDATDGFGLVRELGENNAPRNCETCGEPATRYFYTDGEVSTFRCGDHLPEGYDNE